MKNPSWKLLGVIAWGVLWLILAISFVVPGLGDNPAYDRVRYLAGGVFVALTLIGFAVHAWTTHPDVLQLPFLRGKTRSATKPTGNTPTPVTPPPRKKTGADLPTVLRDRPKTGSAPVPLKKPAAPEATEGPRDSDGNDTTTMHPRSATFEAPTTPTKNA